MVEIQPVESAARSFATAGTYNANVSYAGNTAFNNSGSVYPVLPSVGNFAATTVSTAVPTTFTPNLVVLTPSPRTSPTIVPPYYLVGDSVNAYATLTVAATGAPAPGVTVLFTDSAPRPNALPVTVVAYQWGRVAMPNHLMCASPSSVRWHTPRSRRHGPCP